MIYDLIMAKLHFTSQFIDHEELVNLLPAGEVKPKYELLDNRYYERDYPMNDKTSEYSILVKKQEVIEGTRSENPVAAVLRKEILSPFGFVDDYYFYIIQRKKFTKYWNKNLEIKGYERGKEGIQIPFAILKHIDRNNAEKLSELDIVLEDGSIYFAPASVLFEFFRDKKMPIYINAYATMMTGFPKELFKEKWS